MLAWLHPVSYLLALAAVGLGWALASKRAEHRPIAVLLTVGLACDLARRTLEERLLSPALARLAGAPFSGWIRVPWHVDEALFLLWPAALAVAVPGVFGVRRARPVAVGYAATLAALAIGYPAIRGMRLAHVYLAVELAATAVAVQAIARWVPLQQEPFVQHAAAGAIVGLDALAYAVPWFAGGPFGEPWTLARVAYAVLYAALIVVQGGALWRPASRSS
jgi:hypothetical protein